ncbi:hypothetical protein LTR37_000889 [Vermiconidia calcicola]|uniref:Uncharacterized protein n=1 Tax=Vermiconidia calcicola TaxID=1690605 RepID=A0ACC3NXN7_9PEZI|nr:hypothetical protein LTR37_000889 [Vermiconidia calcicola]
MTEKYGYEEEIGGEDDGLDATAFNSRDHYAMERMGKKQVLMRRFRAMSTFTFNAMATSVGEFGVFSNSQGLFAGGRAGLIRTTIICASSFLPIVLSTAEMPSIAPTARGQYHWVFGLCA